MYNKVCVMENIKRVYCLYRVSTIGQVERDDIPMQRQYCREFVSLHGNWRIEKELYEKGVSGFKVSAKDRDKIQEIQKAAVEGKFKVLLVYMFDRLGRRDDETPFVVEWFVKNGIEVWSAVEGEQRFDSHVDKLLNYIRYWQASGESIKTSIRVKTRLEQLTESGLYTGGTPPYGYKAVKHGRCNSRNREVHDIVVDEDAAQIVRLIFYKYVHEGYGALRISHYLYEQNIFRDDGRNFPNTSINRILKNPIYTGVLRNGNAQSEVIPELQIIDQDTFDRAQRLMKARTQKHGDVPLNLRGQSLLVGIIYCGHCRNRLTLTTSGRKKFQPDGEAYWEKRPRYQCHYNVRHPGVCDGQSGYSVKKLDGIVNEVVRQQLQRIINAPGEDVILEQHEKKLELARAKYSIASKQLEEKRRELADYQAETIKVIRGQSRLDVSLLNELVEKAKGELEVLSAAAEQAKEQLEYVLADDGFEREEYDRLKSWAEVYDSCSFEAKKMFVSKFIKSVYVYRDYELEIEFNVSFDEFRNFTVDLGKEA